MCSAEFALGEHDVAFGNVVVGVLFEDFVPGVDGFLVAIQAVVNHTELDAVAGLVGAEFDSAFLMMQGFVVDGLFEIYLAESGVDGRVVGSKRAGLAVEFLGLRQVVA